MNIWDEIIKAGELQKLKKEAKADIIPVLAIPLEQLVSGSAHYSMFSPSRY